MDTLPDIQVISSDGQQQLDWGRNRPITFEDLGIPRVNAMRTTVFGNIRTCQSLILLEWILLVGGLTSALITIALALYRLWFSKPGEADYVFAILLVFHSAFCILYIFDGVFREQAFEVLAFVASCGFLIVYIVVNFASASSSSSDIFKLVRLVLTIVFGTSMGAVGLVLGFRYWQSANLIFRTVGADTSIQAMCKTLFTTITLILFDAQIVGSVIILALRHSITKLSLQEILTLTIGPPLLLAWAVFAYLGLRLESRYFFSLTMTLSPCHIAYVLFAIIQTALNHEEHVEIRIAYCRYAASAGSLVVHTVLIIFLARCYRNFGMGLKEKVYPRQISNSTSQSRLVQ
ncbi:hypothetical protein O3P69_014054 [Scylla paramamosain]|uniref:DUF7789 domain-containing protein n=1 Tax=Scylla paramamosain TaxID=85552 RepID=A0AAW0SR70_SCYPA